MVLIAVDIPRMKNWVAGKVSSAREVVFDCVSFIFCSVPNLLRPVLPTVTQGQHSHSVNEDDVW